MKYQSSFLMDYLLPSLVSWDPECHTLVMWDEFKAFNADENWIPPIGHLPNNIDTFIAVEPLSWPKFKEPITDSKTLIKLLPTKHRTSKKIDQFVSATIRDKGDLQIQSDSSQPAVQLDYHLEDRHMILPPGQKPIWLSGNNLNLEDLKPK